MSQRIFTDGDYSTRSLVAPTRIIYPFLNSPTKDTASKLFERIYEIDRASYAPFAALSTLPNDGPGDPADATAYLLNESEPTLEVDGTQRVRCLFGKIPAQQIVTGSAPVTIPHPSNVGSTRTLFGYLPGTDTSDAYGGGYLYGTSFFFGLSRFYKPIKTVSAASYVGSKTRMTITAHGFTAGQDLLIIEGQFAGVLLSASQWTIVDVNTIDGPTGEDFSALVTHAAQYSRDAFPAGSRYMRCKRISDFYLPGISPGIATPDDIPIPVDESVSGAFLEKLLAGAGTVNVQVGEMRPWRDSPIYEITKTTIEVTDVAVD